MKKIVIFLILISTLISCGKNVDEEESTKTQISENRPELESSEQWGWWESSEQRVSR